MALSWQSVSDDGDLDDDETFAQGMPLESITSKSGASRLGAAGVAEMDPILPGAVQLPASPLGAKKRASAEAQQMRRLSRESGLSAASELWPYGGATGGGSGGGQMPGPELLELRSLIRQDMQAVLQSTFAEYQVGQAMRRFGGPHNGSADKLGSRQSTMTFASDDPSGNTVGMEQMLKKILTETPKVSPRVPRKSLAHSLLPSRKALQPSAPAPILSTPAVRRISIMSGIASMQPAAKRPEETTEVVSARAESTTPTGLCRPPSEIPEGLEDEDINSEASSANAAIKPRMYDSSQSVRERSKSGAPGAGGNFAFLKTRVTHDRISCIAGDEIAGHSFWREFATWACEHPIFDLMSALLIVFNAATIGAQADYEAKHRTTDVPLAYKCIEKAFCVLFTLELAFRVFAFQSQFLVRTGFFWASFDVFVVTAQLVEEVLLLIWQGTGAGNMSFMRTLRILRLVRILRVVRIIRFMDELRNLVVSIMNSMRSLFWTLVLLLMGIYSIGVYFTQLVADYRILNLETNEADNEFILQYFGGLASSMLSLFQAMSGGIDWNDLCDPLVTNIAPVQGLVFTFYIAFTVLALTNVVTGVFVEGALKSAKEEEEEIMVEGLHYLFTGTDTENTGRITTEQFRGIFTSPHMHQHLESMNVNPFEAASLFALLDNDESGTIDYNEFVGGCMRLRQAAKAIDIIMVMHEAQEIHRNIGEFIERADISFSKLDKFEGSFSKLDKFEEQMDVKIQESFLKTEKLHTETAAAERGARHAPKRGKTGPLPAGGAR